MLPAAGCPDRKQERAEMDKTLSGTAQMLLGVSSAPLDGQNLSSANQPKC